jgi:hypothetical protein
VSAEGKRVNALERSPVLCRVVALLCSSTASAICRELAKHNSRVRSEAFREAAELVSSWSERRADRQTVSNILMELDMKVRAEAAAAEEP